MMNAPQVREREREREKRERDNPTNQSSHFKKTGGIQGKKRTSRQTDRQKGREKDRQSGRNAGWKISSSYVIRQKKGMCIYV